jgi:hypothetical protein
MMEDVSPALLMFVYAMIAILVIFVMMGFLIRLMVSGKFWNIARFIVMAGIVLYLYYRAGGYIYTLYMSMVPFNYNNKNMVHWDDVWYSIFIIFLIMLCSVFIKTVRRGNISWDRLFHTIGVLGVLGFYTIMYYLYMYHDHIFKIVGYLTVAMAIMSGIIYFIKRSGVSYGVAAPFFMIFSVVGLTYIMAGFIFVYKLFGKCYDFLT